MPNREQYKFVEHAAELLAREIAWLPIGTTNELNAPIWWIGLLFKALEMRLGLNDAESVMQQTIKMLTERLEQGGW